MKPICFRNIISDWTTNSSRSSSNRRVSGINTNHAIIASRHSIASIGFTCNLTVVHRCSSGWALVRVTVMQTCNELIIGPRVRACISAFCERYADDGDTNGHLLKCVWRSAAALRLYRESGRIVPRCLLPQDWCETLLMRLCTWACLINKCTGSGNVRVRVGIPCCVTSETVANHWIG